MRIVKPTDWQFIGCVDLDVVVEGTEGQALECLLHTKDEYFNVIASRRAVLARAHLQPIAPDVAIARLSGLQGWGSCVLSIVPQGQEAAECAASGVNLARSSNTAWLAESLRLPPEAVSSAVRYPLPLVAWSLSHVGGAVQEQVQQVTDSSALLSAPDTGPSITVLPLFASEECDAAAVMDRDCCIGFDDPKAQQLRSATPYRSSASYIASIRDCYAVAPAGLVLPEGTRLWSDSTIAPFFNDPAMTQHARMFRALGEPGLVLDDVRTERDILEANDCRQMPGIPMLGFHVAHGNHAHWILNSLPPIFWMRHAIRDGRICVLVPQLSPYILDTLRSLGIPRSSILLMPPGTYQFERLLFPSTLSIHSNSFPPPQLAPMFAHIRQNVARDRGGPGAERIYVTRSGSGTQRQMKNEPALIEALTARGFVCVAPHELSFAEEVRCFSRARIVVGQLGAGLTNVGFAPQGCHLLELTTHNYTGNDYWFMSYVLRHRFSRLMIRSEREDELTLSDFSFEVPIEATLAAIDLALARMTAPVQ